MGDRVTERLPSTISRAVERIRGLQDPEGYWLGGWRSFFVSFLYGTSLIHCGHDPESATIQAICDEIEEHVRPNGGFAHCPEAPSGAEETYAAVLFLRRCRPSSPHLAPAERFLERVGPPAMIPAHLVWRWILDEPARGEVLDYRAPPRWLRRITWKLASPMLSRELPESTSKVPSEPGWRERYLDRNLFRWLFWLVPDQVELLRPETDYPMTPPAGLFAYVPFLALQVLAGDRPLGAGRERTAQFVLEYLNRFVYPDGSIYYQLFAPYFLVLFRALGRTEAEEGLKRALEAATYEPGGWLRCPMLGTNVFETALTIEALLECGVEPGDVAVQRGCDFLQRARRPERIWSWSWSPSAGPTGHRCADSDDTGASLLALTRAGSPHAGADREQVIRVLREFQKENGSFGTFSWVDATQCAPGTSNTSRALQALVALGVSPGDPCIQRGLAWLQAGQQADGTWPDVWMTGPFYSTLLALEALIGLGVYRLGDPAVERALNTILRLQNSDGGWGVDWYGRRTEASLAEHTAWAVYVLATFSRPTARPVSAIRMGVEFLIERQEASGGWPASYVYSYQGVFGYAGKMHVLSFALRALGAARKALDEHRESAPNLQRDLEKKRAAGAPPPSLSEEEVAAEPGIR